MTGKLEDFIRDKLVVHELTDPENKIIMVIGDSDTGKTTLIENIAYSLAKRSAVGIVDLDMGQSHIGPPTTIAWGKVKEGFEDWSGIAAEDFYFTGTVTPVGSLLPSVTGAKMMTDKASATCNRVVIDTTGLIAEPAGRLLKQYKADILSPDIILALECSRELDHILDAFRLLRHPKIYRLPVPDQVETRGTPRRSQYRFEKIVAYFRNAHTIEVRTGDIPLRFTGEPPRSGMAEMENRIVSLRDEQNRDIALGLIEGIDSDEKTLRICTPLSGDKTFAALVIGRAEMDTARGELRDGGISKRKG